MSTRWGIPLTVARRPAEGDSAEVAGQTFEFTAGGRPVAAGSTPVERGRFNSSACVNLYFALREQGFEVFDLGCKKNTFRIGFPNEFKPETEQQDDE